MIKTALQLKAKIRNLSSGDNDRAKVLIRNFVMERFLERLALSPYRDNFVLKGGMLVAAIVGLESRATMDIDATVKSIPLTMETVQKILEVIIQVDVPDGISFSITKAANIMEEHDYPGIRFMLEARLDKLRQMIKIDISAGDVITPQAVEYSYKLMFEDRSISLWTYNLETLLGEKLETILARETANTRMRDFYDIYILTKRESIDGKVFQDAFLATCRQRETEPMIPQMDAVLESVRRDPVMNRMWDKFRSDNHFVGDVSWEDVNESVKALKEKCFYQMDE